MAARGRSRRDGVVGEAGLVIAEIPGRRRSAILVSASVDGSRDGPDVAGALGPAVLLELARVLRAGERPRHTLLLVATESAGYSLGVRALAARPAAIRPVVLEVALEPRGLGGDAALLWASPGAGPAVDAWARAVDAPAGGAHLARLLPSLPARRPWPVVAIGTRRDIVAPGSPRDRPGLVRPATIRSLGQSALQLVRAADGDPGVDAARSKARGPSPSFLELPLHVVVPVAPRTALALGWVALVAVAWALLRLRRHLPTLVACLPWGATGFALAVAAMATLSEALARQRGGASPLQSAPTAHVSCMVFAGLWVLLAWQRLGALGPLARVSQGLSQPAVLAVLSLLALGGTTWATLALEPALTPLAALPLFVAVPSALAVSRAADRRGRFVGAAPLVVALALLCGPALADAVVLFVAQEPRHVELALGIAALTLPVLPAIATATTASVLRPGAGQLLLLAVVTGALAVWTVTAPLSTPGHPRRVVVTAVSHARPGKSVFLVSAEAAVRVDARPARRPWYAAAIEDGRQAVAFAAPDGLSAPPEVKAHLSPRAGGRVLLEVRLRALRRAESIALVLPSTVRVARSSVPVVRLRPSTPWIARVVAPPPAGFEVRMELTLPRRVTLGDLVAIDTGPAAFGPHVPRIDRAWPTRVVQRSSGVTPLDVTYAAAPPAPVLPPDDPAPPPAGPEPWWSIMARERYRRGGPPPP
jgi:hypothetical protein